MTDKTQHTNGVDIDFADIRPYDDHEFRDKIAHLVREPGFEHAVRYVMPDVDYEAFVASLLQVQTQMDFQYEVMGPFLELLVARTTAGLSLSGVENLTSSQAYTFITNHRDIVLDASFLNLCFIRRRLPLTQVAIGNNLLIYDWITDLVKLNRSFIVKRDVGVRQALEAARQLSGYIRHTIRDLGESVWIAQREGRAKDSNDRTQDALVKMLSLAGEGDARQNLSEINILPVAISYEYDPNDFLKVREFLLRRRDPDFRKSQRDDLFSMETGLLGQKGRVHFHLGHCISREIPADCESRTETVRAVCELIDRNIHCGYRIFPCNYIAFDRLEGTDEYSGFYTAADVEAFNAYVDSRLALVNVPDITDEERQFMLHTMLTMYANPLRNQRLAKDCPNL
ncbi:MAG: acyltransferase [Muribaculaceae bacterium]|nr:acyltransferase [Muribaculaceae bacterium]